MDVPKNGESSKAPWRGTDKGPVSWNGIPVGSALHKARKEYRARRALKLREASEGVVVGVKNGKSSMIQGDSIHNRGSLIKGHSEANLSQRSISKFEPAVIEIRGSSEDNDDSKPDPLPVVDHCTATATYGNTPHSTLSDGTKQLAAPKQSSMRDPILPSSRVVWRMHEPEEVEEELEKGNPPRKPPRHTHLNKRPKLDRTLDIPSNALSPIDLVSSSPSGPIDHNTGMEFDLSPPTSPLVKPEHFKKKAIRPSPVPSFPELATPRLTPTPASAPLASDPTPMRRDFQSEIISALDAIYDGGKNRVAMREHEVFNLLSHLHVPEDQMAVMLTWERNTRQWGQMYFTNQVEYITRYIDTYGHVIDKYGARAALKFHFGRLLAEGRLCPPYQSTPSHLSPEQRSSLQNSSALNVFNAVCKVLNAYKTEE